MSSSFIPDDFKAEIRHDFILPHIRNKIKYSLKTETCWATTSITCWISSTIVLIISSIFAFSSSQFPNLPMGFIAGILIVIGTGFKDFTYFATHVDHIKSQEINNTLKNIGINFTLNDDSQLIQQGISESGQDEKSKLNQDEESKFVELNPMNLGSSS